MTTDNALTSKAVAALLVIGNKILSGRTKDKNIGYIAEYLTALGIDLNEVRVVGDEETAIVDALNALRHRYTYVFTTGGIGPTHDDITSDCVAKAFGVPIDVDPRALAILHEWLKATGAEMSEAVGHEWLSMRRSQHVTNYLAGCSPMLSSGTAWIRHVIRRTISYLVSLWPRRLEKPAFVLLDHRTKRVTPPHLARSVHLLVFVDDARHHIVLIEHPDHAL
jgi:molybdenum cofactor synthesis domain-containing protein